MIGRRGGRENSNANVMTKEMITTPCYERIGRKLIKLKRSKCQGSLGDVET